ncbi:MAG: hypothetical protein HY700_13650 [Gemmatimonadetes bacterium]|nr:hypothetical protein [Gemmatimonadota bacterium]
MKFRQAAFVYLHFGILYEAGAYAMWRNGLIPENWGPPWIWVLIVGPFVAGSVFVGLLRWQKPWFAALIWLIGAGRLPTLIHGAFVTSDTGVLAPSFYLTALVVSVINLWMLARAAWDL